MGAVGTIVATLFKKEQVKDRLKCVYCDGTGIISCGRCLGSSQLASMEGGTVCASRVVPHRACLSLSHLAPQPRHGGHLPADSIVWWCDRRS